MNKIYSLQAMRGIAAFAVVLIHSMASTLVFVTSVDGEVVNYFNYGLLGVDFFFVLSGFIIFNSHFNDPENNQTLKTYFSKRLVRIFPPYLPISLAYIIVLSLVPSISEKGHEWGFLSSVFLLPTSSPTALGPAWTLVYELMFYAVFSLWFFARAQFKYIVFGWLTLIVLFNVFFGYEYLQQNNSFPPDLTSLLIHLTSKLNIEFMAGMLCAYLYRLEKDHAYTYLSLFMFMCLIVICYFFIPNDFHSLKSNGVFYGVSFAFLIYGIVKLEQQINFKIPTFLILLGDASYAIYLVHYPIVSLVSRINGRFFDINSAVVNILICTLVSIFIGIVYHKKFEKPLISFITVKLKKKQD